MASSFWRWCHFVLYKKEYQPANQLLTGHVLTRLERLINIRIHIDHEILITGYLLVSFFDNGVNPLFKNRSYQCINYISDIPSWKFGYLALSLR